MQIQPNFMFLILLQQIQVFIQIEDCITKRHPKFDLEELI